MLNSSANYTTKEERTMGKVVMLRTARMHADIGKVDDELGSGLDDTMLFAAEVILALRRRRALVGSGFRRRAAIRRGDRAGRGRAGVVVPFTNINQQKEGTR